MIQSNRSFATRYLGTWVWILCAIDSRGRMLQRLNLIIHLVVAALLLPTKGGIEATAHTLQQ